MNAYITSVKINKYEHIILLTYVKFTTINRSDNNVTGLRLIL